MAKQEVRPVESRRLQIQESASYLGVSTTTLRRMKNKGEIPFYKVRGLLVFDTRDLDKYLAANRFDGGDVA
jgi:excisionase family DNA binding protein